MSTPFWGEKTSYLNFCEEDYLVTRYVAEFINTLSSLIFGQSPDLLPLGLVLLKRVALDLAHAKPTQSSTAPMASSQHPK